MTSTAALVRTGEPGEKSSALAEVRPALALLRPIAQPAAIMQVQNEMRALIKETLEEGRDYGVIPGTDKPSLLKPGAERIALSYGCYYGDPVILEKEIDHNAVVEWTKRKKKWRNQFAGDREFEWVEESGVSRGIYRYVVGVSVLDRGSGQVVGHGIGVCSTMESKYVDRPRDSENTALKMAHKRAVVGACLITFGLSDEFTQDTEDTPREQLVGENAPQLEKMDPPCPKCGQRMFDNRLSKKNPKAPDFKCRDRKCEGVIWPPKPNDGNPQQPAAPTSTNGGAGSTSASSSSTSTTSQTEGPTFPYGERKGVPLTARHPEGATRVKRGKRGEPDEILDCGGEYVVRDSELEGAIDWVHSKLHKHARGEIELKDPERFTQMADALEAEQRRRDVEQDLAADVHDDEDVSPGGDADDEDDEDDDVVSYGEPLPRQGEPSPREPVVPPPAKGAPDSVFVLTKRFNQLIAHPRFPESIRVSATKDMRQRANKSGYAAWLAESVDAAEEYLRAQLEQKDLAALGIEPKQ